MQIRIGMNHKEESDKFMSKTTKRIWNIVTGIIAGLVALMVVFIWVLPMIGMELFLIQSGSMEPDYPTGSIVYVTKVEATELKVNDVITFNLGSGTKATHRIIDIVPDETNPNILRFKTKGDANEHEDHSLVESHNIVGRVLFHIPYMGYVVNYIQHPPGTYVSIAVVSLVLLMMFLPDLIIKKEKV